MLMIGCGAGESSDGEIAVEVGSLTKAQFVERATEICERGRVRFETRLNAYFQRNSDLEGASRTELATAANGFVETIYLPEQERQIEEISELGAPASDEDEITAILEAIQKGLVEAESNPLKFVRALNINYRPFAEAERLAKAYGVESCGRG